VITWNKLLFDGLQRPIVGERRWFPGKCSDHDKCHPFATQLASSSVGSMTTTQDFVVQTIEDNLLLQHFVESTWSSAYAGRMPFPVWSQAYFDWQFCRRIDEPDRRLAVYSGETLVAVLLGVPYSFEAASGSLRGAHWSWLSVAESYRGRGLVKLLDSARVNLELNSGSDLIVSFRQSGSRHSLAERPSTRFPLKSFHSRTGFWVQALDGSRLLKWNVNRFEGVLGRLITLIMPKPEMRFSDRIRMLNHGDLDQCRQVANQQFAQCVLRIRWDAKSIEHQLAGSPISQTVVAEEGGVVRGFVNFHILPFQGLTLEPVAIIDLICVNQLRSELQTKLVRSALGLMRQQGAILALKIRSQDVAAPLMLRTGFAARWPDTSLVLQWTDTARPIPKKKPVHVLFR